MSRRREKNALKRRHAALDALPWQLVDGQEEDEGPAIEVIDGAAWATYAANVQGDELSMASREDIEAAQQDAAPMPEAREECELPDPG